MAVVYADLNGKLLGFATTLEQQETLYPTIPSGTQFTVSFDELTNAAVVQDMALNLAPYTAPAGVLNKSGVPVVIAAASALFTLESAIETGVPVPTLEAAIVSLWNGTATTAQTQKALAYCLLKLHRAGLI